MVDQIPLRTKGLSTLGAGKWSLSSVLAHVHWGSCVRQKMATVSHLCAIFQQFKKICKLTSKIKLFHKALATVWTQMTLLIFDTNMPVHFVRFQLTFRHKAAATHIAQERLFPGVDSQVVIQLCLASK